MLQTSCAVSCCDSSSKLDLAFWRRWDGETGVKIHNRFIDLISFSAGELLEYGLYHITLFETNIDI